MKLITFESIETDRKLVYKDIKQIKTNWLGQYVGEEIVPSTDIAETIIYRKKYTIPADKITVLIEDVTQNSSKYTINGYAVEKNEFERVKKLLEEI